MKCINGNNPGLAICLFVILGIGALSKKNVFSWFKAVLVMAFYIGLFGGIGYLLQITIL
jgi:hypothetical protein